MESNRCCPVVVQIAVDINNATGVADFKTVADLGMLTFPPLLSSPPLPPYSYSSRVLQFKYSPKQRNRESSVEIKSEWTVVEQIEFSQLQKASFAPPEPEELYVLIPNNQTQLAG